jgi:hypothetical protein
MSAFSIERLSLEEKAKLKVMLFLESLGCKIIDLKINKILSLKSFDFETKKMFLEYKGTKYDLLVTRKRQKSFS